MLILFLDNFLIESYSCILDHKTLNRPALRRIKTSNSTSSSKSFVLPTGLEPIVEKVDYTDLNLNNVPEKRHSLAILGGGSSGNMMMANIMMGAMPTLKSVNRLNPSDNIITETNDVSSSSKLLHLPRNSVSVLPGLGVSSLLKPLNKDSIKSEVSTANMSSASTFKPISRNSISVIPIMGAMPTLKPLNPISIVETSKTEDINSPLCKECGCTTFKPHAFKKGQCNICYHAH